LRDPLKKVDSLLERLHELYHQPELISSFLTSLAVLPQTIAQIFGFRQTLYFVDHFDRADIDVQVDKRRRIRIFEYLKFSLDQCQYLVSCVDGEEFCPKLARLELE
jgi:hypothetical protein